jgi:tetratricopeptide (TPR) repeat protein
MNVKRKFTDKDLIKKAHLAMQVGKTNAAREYAISASETYPENEQAWLILASLSEPEQALLYLENALRINPRSLAAHKGIRLIYSQMADRGSPEANPEEKAKPSLADTAPIPIPENVNIEEENPPPSTEETTESIETTSDIHEPEQEEQEVGEVLEQLTKKEILRSHLLKKTSDFTLQPTTVENLLENLTAEKEESVQQVIENISTEQQIEMESVKEYKSAEIEEELPIVESQTPQSPSEEKEVKKAPSKAAESPNEPLPTQVPSKKLIKGEPKISKKKRAKRTSETDLKKKAVQQKAIEIKQIKTPHTKQPPDVDVIELVLVSIGALLVPLLVLLYFLFIK